MQHVGKLTQLAAAAATVSEIALKAQTHRFGAPGPLTLYAHIEAADVTVERRALPYLEVSAQLQAPFVWRVAFDQDEAGVYVVALRRALVGDLGGGSFRLIVRPDTYLQLRLDGCKLTMLDLHTTVELPPGGGVLLTPAQPASG
ncbi:MAG: hypothetical protein JNL34_13770 [Anaerolineae bacterium]|nr:hypothetical protein [Anaerolineae bacterium]